ncbi:hypothetical protein [Polaromonas sp. CG9_12]|uniref:hypothetical protein n=1 Tax=Polaromonas sp. CG_9.11 TaxID=2787730 RepID=UPI0004DDD5A4|nr:hypothetical protein [Polaromonas sp. CG_9.11]MBG6075651.1 hypothetical protein [Polaromonas sp. CG_9.11]CDS52566.1 hypothetical protein [Polaromonas sp. CG9_12]
MFAPKYKIESNGTLASELLLDINFDHLYDSSSLAVAIAAKSITLPVQQEVRVVRVPDGEVIFRTKVGEAANTTFS